MKSRLHIFPLMIFVIVIIFGFKSYDFAMGLDNPSKNQNSTDMSRNNDVASMLNNIETAAGQQAEVAGENAQAGDFDATGPQDFNQGAFPYTADEIQLLQRLSERREELDQRSRDMDIREKLLIATENGIDKKIASLKSIEEQIKVLIEIHDEQEKAQIESLVQTYSAMKPKDAAIIFNTLDMDILISIIARMKPKTVAKVLAQMKTSSANDITVELATRKKLPNIEG